jgi:hypothetical protein
MKDEVDEKQHSFGKWEMHMKYPAENFKLRVYFRDQISILTSLSNSHTHGVAL